MDTTVSQTRTVNGKRIRRALDLSLNGVFWIVFLFVVFLAYGSVPNHFYQVLMVNSGSMSPTIEAGDLIVVTKPPEALRPGMVLTMVVNGGIVTHRLVDLGSDGQLITRGDANEVNDRWESADISVRGLYRFRIPRLGLLLNGPMQWLRGTVSGSWFTDADSVAFSIGAAWATQEPPGPGCTYSQGYWKNHPGEWPVDQLIIGGVTYTKTELLAFLNAPAGGDPTMILIQQFIAALLNVENGADPAAVAATLTAADVYLATYPPGSSPADRSGIDLAEILDEYNNGEIGPGHCDDPGEEPTPTRTQPVVPPVYTGCVHSHGYWKNHGSDWPVDRLTVGGQEYEKEALLLLLDAPTKGDKTLILAQQYVAALLNVENGADPLEVQEALDDAEALFEQYQPGSDPQDKDVRQQAVSLAAQLDQFNNGKLGPPACDDQDDDPEPASRLVQLATPTPTAPLVPVEPQAGSAEKSTPTPTATAEPSPTPTLTVAPTEMATPEPTATLEAATETPAPEATETPEPEATETPEPAATETPEPEVTEVTESTEG